MLSFSERLLPRIKTTLREAGNDFNDEIKSYIETCAADLKNAGILKTYFETVPEDPQIVQAVRWYCLSVYGLYNSDMEKYTKAYRSLKATLCTQKKYTKTEDKDGI